MSVGFLTRTGRASALLAEAFARSAIAKLVIDDTGVVIEANAAFEQLIGRDPVGDTFPGLREPGDQVLMRPDGTAVPVSATVTSVADGAFALVELTGTVEATRLRTTIEVQREITASTHGRDAVLRLIADRAIALFPGADGAAVVLAEDAQLRCVTAAGTLTEAAGAVVPATGTFTGIVLTTGGTVASPDTGRDDRLDRDACERLGVRSAISSALYAGTEVIGSLTVTAGRPGSFDGTDEQHLALLADGLSAALRQADDAARDARQARILELIPAAVIVRDLDGTIRWWNTGAEELYGWSAAAAAGQVTHRLLDTVFPPGTGVAELHDALTAAGRWDGQLEHQTADGRRVTVLSRQVLHQFSGTDCQVLEINADITATRAAERALAESEQRFRAQFTNSAAGQAIRALDGHFVAVNPAYARMVGYSIDELLGMTDADLYDPVDLADSRRLVADLFAGADSYTHEARLRHAGGRWVDVEATVSLVRDQDGRPKNIVVVATDITDRRTAERTRDQATDQLADRNDELEAANRLKMDIIAMLGHEIGNPLSSIRGYAELLTDDEHTLDEDRRARSMQAIVRQAARLDEIVQVVLALVTVDSGVITADRHELVLRDEIAKALTAADSERLPVDGATGVRVLVNPGHLQQILVNLLSNAAKYGGGATAVNVIRQDGSVAIEVIDNGPGVPEEFRPHLFERLTRASRDAFAVHGTGLGLYIVRGLAHANHGDIRHRPNPAGGSIFTLTVQAAG